MLHYQATLLSEAQSITTVVGYARDYHPLWYKNTAGHAVIDPKLVF